MTEKNENNMIKKAQEKLTPRERWLIVIVMALLVTGVIASAFENINVRHKHKNVVSDIACGDSSMMVLINDVNTGQERLVELNLAKLSSHSIEKYKSLRVGDTVFLITNYGENAQYYNSEYFLDGVDLKINEDTFKARKEHERMLEAQRKFNKIKQAQTDTIIR